jgi:Fe-S-cluster containining protein
VFRLSLPLTDLFGNICGEIARTTGQYTSGTGLCLLTPEQTTAWLKQELPSVCLRCGLCCFQYEVDNIPGYGIAVKPICQECRYHETAVLQASEWRLSGCRIHAHRPDVCAAYQGNISPLAYAVCDGDGHLTLEVPCAQGLKYWTKLLRLYGGKLPSEIARFFAAESVFS